MYLGIFSRSNYKYWRGSISWEKIQRNVHSPVNTRMNIGIALIIFIFCFCVWNRAKAPGKNPRVTVPTAKKLWVLPPKATDLTSLPLLCLSFCCAAYWLNQTGSWDSSSKGWHAKWAGWLQQLGICWEEFSHFTKCAGSTEIMRPTGEQQVPSICKTSSELLIH